MRTLLALVLAAFALALTACSSDMNRKDDMMMKDDAMKKDEMMKKDKMMK